MRTILTLLTIFTLKLFFSNGELINNSETPISEPDQQVTLNENSTALSEKHGKKLINPKDQFEGIANITNETTEDQPVKIHYVDFKLTENYNTSNEFYVVRTNNTDGSNDSIPLDNDGDSLIGQGKHMLSSFYNKVAHLTDSMDTSILYNLWIPFVSGFAVGLALLILIFCCRLCCRRCFCCRRYTKISQLGKAKRSSSKKMQSLDDNRYLLVSNHSDSEGV